MMLVRVLRTICGILVLLVGLPTLLAGAVLWLGMQHGTGGTYTAPLAEISTDGYAVVASDVDGLLRQDAPFTRAGRTTLRLTAHTSVGPAFIGLAPAADAARYLDSVPYEQVNEVRLARGPLPVATEPMPQTEPRQPPPPHAQDFWVATSDPAGNLEWSPAEVRGEQLALVVMNIDGELPDHVQITAQVHPTWLGPTTWGLLGLGTVLLCGAVMVIGWPARPQDVIYVMPSTQAPDDAAGLALPHDRSMLLQVSEPVGAGIGNGSGAAASAVGGSGVGQNWPSDVGIAEAPPTPLEWPPPPGGHSTTAPPTRPPQAPMN